jgi:hypothetical protein
MTEDILWPTSRKAEAFPTKRARGRAAGNMSLKIGLQPDAKLPAAQALPTGAVR